MKRLSKLTRTGIFITSVIFIKGKKVFGKDKKMSVNDQKG